ncbi:proline iminopeptidase-family hydrolase [Oenococcus oeni]|uniref:proline iminopeptidase-family hydrolase n=1 Tax=Oenococcus oeni TaxID=1247 RepID=UPI003EE55AE0
MKHQTKILHLKNGYDIWSASFGNPDAPIKLLTLHGGPGGTSKEFWPWAENFQKYVGMDVQVFTYDQLGSFWSESPDWTKKENVDKFLNYQYYLDELEEVRSLMGLDHFYLLGHSWGGVLTYEYSLAHPEHLKGSIVYSMTDNIKDYVTSINQERLDLLGQDEVDYMKSIEAKEDFSYSRYHADLNKLYKENIERTANYNPDAGPDLLATDVYNHFQGNNEFVVTGILKDWNIRPRLHNIKIPMLLTTGEKDTMPVWSMKETAKTIPRAELFVNKDGGHHHAVDHPVEFYNNLAAFLKRTEAAQ